MHWDADYMNRFSWQLFSMDEFALAQAVFNDLQSQSELLEIPADRVTAIASFENSYELLIALAYLRPKSFDVIVLDVPRASKTMKVELPNLDDLGRVIWSEVAHDDPDYLFRLKSNAIAIIRLANACLSSEGLLLAIATPFTYVAIRTSIEHLFGHGAFLGEFVYQTRTGGANDSTYMDIQHETLLVYARDSSRVSGFQIEKSPEELEKYKEEDEKGRYKWDTYIRKQARNYYKIKCPDGTFLEKDKNGNRISWLWSEQTFKQKLKDGEVKFVPPRGPKKEKLPWTLLYKDRFKSFKIVRSLTLFDTKLTDITKDAPDDATGRDLLTERGSLEIKEFVGEKPEYLKPSKYFEYVLSVFGRSKRVFVPFNEYGAALTACLSRPDLQAEVFVNNHRKYEKLIKWRLKRIKGLKRDSYSILSKLKTFDIKSPSYGDHRISTFVRNYISSRDAAADSWSELTVDEHKLHISEGSSLHILIEWVKPDSHASPCDLLPELAALRFNTALPLVVWTSLNEDVIRSSYRDLVDFKFMQFPNFLVV